jgi:hypothetical protein
MRSLCIQVKVSSPKLKLGKKKNWSKTYNSGYSLVVTDPTTNPPISSLCMAERTGCPVLLSLWSYVPENTLFWFITCFPVGCHRIQILCVIEIFEKDIRLLVLTCLSQIDAFKLQAHAMFLDTSFNTLRTVFSNIHDSFIETATKMWQYAKCLPLQKQPGAQIVISK